MKEINSIKEYLSFLINKATEETIGNNKTKASLYLSLAEIYLEKNKDILGDEYID